MLIVLHPWLLLHKPSQLNKMDQILDLTNKQKKHTGTINMHLFKFHEDSGILKIQHKVNDWTWKRSKERDITKYRMYMRLLNLSDLERMSWTQFYGHQRIPMLLGLLLLVLSCLKASHAQLQISSPH